MSRRFRAAFVISLISFVPAVIFLVIASILLHMQSMWYVAFLGWGLGLLLMTHVQFLYAYWRLK